MELENFNDIRIDGFKVIPSGGINGTPVILARNGYGITISGTQTEFLQKINVK
jgi:hypothetical protein